MVARSKLTAAAETPTRHRHILAISSIVASSSYFSTLLILRRFKSFASSCRTFLSVNNSDYFLEPPDVRRLAETARISLTTQEVKEFTPKIRQVVDWFGQLQGVQLQSSEPVLRADTEDDHLQEDVPEQFENSYDEPFIRVPKVLNKE